MNEVHDQLSELDKRIVVALQPNGRASWRTVAEAVGASTATVARRGQQLLAEGVVKVAVVPVLAAGGPYSAFWVRINCAPGESMKVAEQLAGSPDVRFCAVVAGEYDIVAEIVLRGDASTYPRLLQDLQSLPGVQRWRSDYTLHVYKVSFDWGRQLFGQEPSTGHVAPTPDEPEECSPQHLDGVDQQIVAALQTDGRETFQRIADDLDLNESSVRRRYERLRANGCLDVLTLVQSAALGMGAETLVQVTVDPGRLEAVAAELAGFPFVRYLALMLDENSLLCELIMPNSRDLRGFMTGPLSRMRGVRGWSASMELVFLKRGFVETPWWRTQTGLVDT
ncbi:Lrp/AsnC family transcriptional regulator [Kineococcus terrestris]|uniref:Lrp/AsnC family transcriptional regulator n=1 Tax=Kineococcus terrestris TaxID=2044856 RepID=UPI0034DB1C67